MPRQMRWGSSSDDQENSIGTIAAKKTHNILQVWWVLSGSLREQQKQCRTASHFVINLETKKQTRHMLKTIEFCHGICSGPKNDKIFVRNKMFFLFRTNYTHTIEEIIEFSIITVVEGIITLSKCVSAPHHEIKIIVVARTSSNKRWTNKIMTHHKRLHCKYCALF